MWAILFLQFRRLPECRCQDFDFQDKIHLSRSSIQPTICIKRSNAYNAKIYLVFFCVMFLTVSFHSSVKAPVDCRWKSLNSCTHSSTVLNEPQVVVRCQNFWPKDGRKTVAAPALTVPNDLWRFEPMNIPVAVNIFLWKAISCTIYLLFIVTF